jgi:glycine/D-amino acid oxidase-like deaminating enzyme
LHKAGHTEADYRWLDARELDQQVRMRNPYGAIFSPHCAVINPVKLVRGLAEAVERKGVTIYENTPVKAISGHSVVAPRGQLHAKIIVPALEGYSGSIADYGKYLLPVQSLIVATEPLSHSQWDEIGLANRPAFSDGGRLVTYGQRTADGRLIFGARGGYLFGAKPRSQFSLQDPEFEIRKKLMYDLFPALQGVQVTHGWGGTMGMARSFAPHVLFDPDSGIGWAGGYGGGGVGASNLLARTLADLILERNTELTRMPWVIQGKSPAQALRKWEPEPFRWLTYKTILAAYSWEESLCRSSSAPSWRKSVAGKLSDALARLMT